MLAAWHEPSRSPDKITMRSAARKPKRSDNAVTPATVVDESPSTHGRGRSCGRSARPDFPLCRGPLGRSRGDHGIDRAAKRPARATQAPLVALRLEAQNLE